MPVMTTGVALEVEVEKAKLRKDRDSSNGADNGEIKNEKELVRVLPLPAGLAQSEQKEVQTSAGDEEHKGENQQEQEQFGTLPTYNKIAVGNLSADLEGYAYVRLEAEDGSVRGVLYYLSMYGREAEVKTIWAALLAYPPRPIILYRVLEEDHLTTDESVPRIQLSVLERRQSGGWHLEKKNLPAPNSRGAKARAKGRSANSSNSSSNSSRIWHYVMIPNIAFADPTYIDRSSRGGVGLGSSEVSGSGGGVEEGETGPDSFMLVVRDPQDDNAHLAQSGSLTSPKVNLPAAPNGNLRSHSAEEEKVEEEEEEKEEDTYLAQLYYARLNNPRYPMVATPMRKEWAGWLWLKAWERGEIYPVRRCAGGVKIFVCKKPDEKELQRQISEAIAGGQLKVAEVNTAAPALADKQQRGSKTKSIESAQLTPAFPLTSKDQTGSEEVSGQEQTYPQAS